MPGGAQSASSQSAEASTTAKHRKLSNVNVALRSWLVYLESLQLDIMFQSVLVYLRSHGQQ